MKTLVFSDTHLCTIFEPKKFEFLKQLITEADRVIINGDFWDGFLTSFNDFINSPWKQLFPLLKTKQTVYVFGNHDRSYYTDPNVNLFSTHQTTQYVLKEGSKIFVFEHGNRLFPSFDETFKIPKSILRLCARTQRVIEKIFIRTTKKSMRLLGVLFNKRLKIKLKTLEQSYNTIHIFGHTHFAEYDPDHNFLNTGFIQHGLAQYAFIENNHITPKEEWYG